MKKIKLALVGCAGRMGQQIIKELQNFKNVNLSAAIESQNSVFLNKKIKKIKITSDKKLAFIKSNIIIDFSSPESTLETVKYATKLKKKLVIGTTGLSLNQISNIKKASKNIAIIFAPNMSIGINLLLNIANKSSNILFNSETSVEVLDIHQRSRPFLSRQYQCLVPEHFEKD